jgi:hypothetical protein
MDLSCLSDEEKEASYMEFTVNGRTERADYDPNNTNPSKGVLYGFTCSIASVEMAEEITAVYHYGEGETTETTYSAQEYIETAQQTPDYPSEALALVYAIADYGYYVQTFLADVYGWTLGEGDDQYAQMGQCYTESYDVDAIKAAVADYGIVRENNSDDIEKITYSVRLDSETAILVYFKPVKNYNGRFTVTLDDESYTATKQGDGRYLVEIPNIGAHLLGRTYTIAVTTDAGSATVAVAALSYVKGMLAAYVGVTNAENAACAIYAYYAAAAAYMAES